MGCDISPEESGLVGIDRVAYLQALSEFDEEGAQNLRAKPFAAKLRRLARHECRLRYSAKLIAKELERVTWWFTLVGTFYNDGGNLRSVLGELLANASPATRRHMREEVNPKTRGAFTVAEQRKIDLVSPQNLLHNSTTRRNTIRGSPPQATGIRWLPAK